MPSLIECTKIHEVVPSIVDLKSKVAVHDMTTVNRPQ